jgi:hypothetical protein
MAKRYRGRIILPVLLLLFIVTLARVDRIFFKRGSSFSVRFLYSNLENRPEWQLPPPTDGQLTVLDQVLKQKFHYLAKGAHCYAFISEDQNYVVKFHRYASHMRKLSWVNHPFSYRFSERRKKIKEYNLQKLSYNLKSYIDSFQNLQEETGLIFLHINHTENLRRHITLVDKTKAEYQVPLDDVTFILQHKANLIYPTLDTLVGSGKIEEAKQVVTSIVQLITSCCQKGFVDEDPVLRKNYGLLAKKAIHIDIGDLIRKEGIEKRENYIPHVKEMTESLRKRLETTYPALLEHYNQEIANL